MVSYNSEGSIFKGLTVTLEISFFAIVLGTLLGVGICILRMSRFKPFSVFARIYISVLRGSPLTMLLMLLYYCVFARTRLDAMWVAVITFGINSAAYIAEMFRSAIEGVNKREIEAALTLGFNKFQTMRYVVFPQAMHIAKPVYQSFSIKDSSYGSTYEYTIDIEQRGKNGSWYSSTATSNNNISIFN